MKNCESAAKALIINDCTDLEQEKLNLNEIKKVYEYCKSYRDFQGMENELNENFNN